MTIYTVVLINLYKQMKTNYGSTIKLLLLIIFAGSGISTIAQDYNLYKKKWMVQGGDTLPYRVLYPLNYDSTKNYPVLFFLHGAGERGKDNEKQLT